MKKKDILFVDGYNMIGAWPLFKPYRHNHIEIARDILLFELSNYSNYSRIEVIVVFDAQFVPGVTKRFDKYNVQVVFTDEGETADSFIEKEVQYYINPLNRVYVATSDMAEQWMIFQQGALRQSAQELLIEIQFAKKQIAQEMRHYFSKRNYRNSPWKANQFKQLEKLRFKLNAEK